ncbi:MULTISPECIES: hypothetical protein [Bacillus]|uniref:hypothetical protein n=1 Tax=Bacillus TaxID=1386 RepID=UPI000EFB125E|nr:MULTISPECIES: hypothetical protein [Bacillus]HEO2443922.1 hypothetical protein [Streptococcus agalactiae]MCT6515534.1 hypothetical protein [Bacillus subtilis]MCV4329347.1 hypothetical protein [Bacillus velezensis]MDH3075828.1 hypothetical protein [Bacillus velezensis]MDH3104094.1 hypothetical protein [Bacillus velezensis]
MKTRVFEANLFVKDQLEETIESPISIASVFKKAKNLSISKQEDVQVRMIQHTNNRIHIFCGTIIND